MFKYMDSLPDGNINLASSAMKGMNPEGLANGEVERQIAKIYSVDPDQVIITPSGTFSSFFVLYHLRKKIRSLVTIVPEYPVFFYQAREIGIDVVLDNRLTSEGADLSPWDVEEKTAYFLSNPNNPTGLSWTDESLKSIGRETEGNESYLIIDDTFSFFNGAFPKKLETGNTILIGSVSKFFGDSGIKMGWIIAGKNLIEDIRERLNFMVPVISTLVRRRASYLFDNVKVYVDYNKKKLQENSDILFDALDEYIISYRGSIINALSVGRDSSKFSLSLMNSGVLTVPGYFFGADSIIRVGIGSEDSERVRRGAGIILEKIKDWMR
ncbi:MAG: pyridoxal phosphate-dependent aminotransferase, partial [Thermoplasmatales archaeon]